MENVSEEKVITETISEPVVEPAPVVSKKNKPEYGKVIGGKLNLRAEPDKDSDILTILDNDFVVTIVGKNYGSYYKVVVSGITGYCAKEYIKIVK